VRSSARTVGILLAGGGSLLLAVIVIWGISGLTGDDLETSGFLLLLGLALVVLLPVILGGGYMLVKGSAEVRDLAKVDEQRKLLNLVQARGQVSISDLVLDLKSTRDQVQASLVELVGRGLFSGYVDWQKGMLYSVEASKLQGRQTCPNCGGAVELVGKGMIRCPYCGAEIFLT
jgi:hypothetical protein